LVLQERLLRREQLHKLAELQIYELVKAHLREPFDASSPAPDDEKGRGAEKEADGSGTSASGVLLKILAKLIVTVENVRISVQGTACVFESIKAVPWSFDLCLATDVVHLSLSFANF
jgi:hypothetical protein